MAFRLCNTVSVFLFSKNNFFFRRYLFFVWCTVNLRTKLHCSSTSVVSETCPRKSKSERPDLFMPHLPIASKAYLYYSTILRAFHLGCSHISCTRHESDESYKCDGVPACFNRPISTCHLLSAWVTVSQRNWCSGKKYENITPTTNIPCCLNQGQDTTGCCVCKNFQINPLMKQNIKNMPCYGQKIQINHPGYLCKIWCKL